jgi:hypothetical protein
VTAEKTGPNAPLPAPEWTEEAALAPRNALLDHAVPEHEKAVVVRVPTSAPTFQVKLPHERWLACMALVSMLNLSYGSVFVLLALWGSSSFALVAALVAAALATGAMLVRRLFTEADVSFDATGLRYNSGGLFGRSGTLAAAHVRGFVVQVKRRSLDNRESCHLYASLADGRTVHIGRTRTHEEASAVIRGLEETLAAIRVTTVGYRAAF